MFDVQQPPAHHKDTQVTDLGRVEVRADLVQVRVVREERILRNVVRAGNTNTSVPGLRDVGCAAILVGDAQADDLCNRVQNQVLV